MILIWKNSEKIKSYLSLDEVVEPDTERPQLQLTVVLLN